MKKLKHVAAGLIIMLLISPAIFSQTKAPVKTTAQVKSDVLTNKNITDLQKAGLGDEIILAKISSSKCSFDLSTDALVDLKAKGVSSEVIKAMLSKNEGSSPVINTAVSTSKAGASPELVNYVYLVQKEHKAMLPLEKSVAGKRTKNYGIKGVVLLQVEGANSGLQISAEQVDYFLINTGGGSLPELTLYTLKAVKGNREVESMSVGTFSGVKTNEKFQIPLNISKLSNGVFKIMPVKALEKGEYFFTTKPEATASSFDVYTIGLK
jgi:hypothetical protein